jgi:hypothetical protein
VLLPYAISLHRGIQRLNSSQIAAVVQSCCNIHFCSGLCFLLVLQFTQKAVLVVQCSSPLVAGTYLKMVLGKKLHIGKVHVMLADSHRGLMMHYSWFQGQRSHVSICSQPAPCFWLNSSPIAERKHGALHRQDPAASAFPSKPTV